MNRPLFTVYFLWLSLALLSQLQTARTEEEGTEDATTKDPRIVSETFGLEPGANVSRHTNFTLLDESLSKKMILELWVEKKPKEEPAERRRRLEEHGGESEMIYQLNGMMYLINQGVFSQND